MISFQGKQNYDEKESDGQLLETQAQHTGIVIERTVGLNLLHDIGIHLIGSEEEDEVLKQIIAGAIKLTGAISGVIYLISDDGKKVLRKYPYPLDIEHPLPRLDNEQGYTRQVIDSQKTLIIENLSDDERMNPILSKKIQAAIGVPMKIAEKVVGVLFLHDRIPRSFTETERSLLENLADQGAIAVKKAGLVRELRQKNKELEVLNKMGRRVSAANIKSIAKEVYYRTAALVDIDKFFLCMADQGNRKGIRLNFVLWCDNGEFLERKPMAVSGLTGWIISHGKSFLVRDWNSEEKKFPVKPRIIAEPQQSWLGVPMMIGKEVIGVISVQNREANVFNEDTVRLMEIIASQVAIAIRNAQLFQSKNREHKKQIRAIRQISDSIATPMEPAKMFKGILKWAISLIGKSNLGEIRLLNPKTNELEVMAPYGVKAKKEYDKIPVGKGLIGWVAEHKSPKMVLDVSQNRQYLPIHDGTKSEIVVPMMKGQELIGVLNIENPNVNAFTPGDLELAQAIAGLAVVAIENARLYKNLEQIIKDLKEATRHIAKTQKILIRENLAFDFIHYFRNLAGTIPIWSDMIRKCLDLKLSKDREIALNTDRIDKDFQALQNAIEHLESPSNPIPRDMNTLLEKLLRQIKILHSEDREISIESDIAPNLYPVNSTVHDVSNIFWSIIINGIEAMPKGGILKIRAANAPDENHRRWVRFVVEDQGRGIPPGRLEQIFAPHYSSKGKDRGYGLWRCKLLVERMGGQIKVESRVNSGSQFLILLPGSDQKQKALLPHRKEGPHEKV